MNLDKLFTWIAGIVIAFAVMGKIDVLQAAASRGWWELAIEKRGEVSRIGVTTQPVH